MATAIGLLSRWADGAALSFRCDRCHTRSADGKGAANSSAVRGRFALSFVGNFDLYPILACLQIEHALIAESLISLSVISTHRVVKGGAMAATLRLLD